MVGAVLISQVILAIIALAVQLQGAAEPRKEEKVTVEQEKVASIEPLETQYVALPQETTVEETTVETTTAEETTTEVEPETTTEIETEPETTVQIEVETTQQELDVLRSFYKDIDSSTDMSQNLGISKERFVEIMNVLPYDYVDVFKNNADVLWEIAKKYDFNEFLMVGIIAQESGWGENPVAKNNYSSQRISGSKYYSYDTFEEGAEVLARNLANNYLSEDGKYYSGKSLDGIGVKYCEGDTWSGKVASCIYMVLKEYFNAM